MRLVDEVVRLELIFAAARHTLLKLKVADLIEGAVGIVEAGPKAPATRTVAECTGRAVRVCRIALKNADMVGPTTGPRRADRIAPAAVETEVRGHRAEAVAVLLRIAAVALDLAGDEVAGLGLAVARLVRGAGSMNALAAADRAEEVHGVAIAIGAAVCMG